MKEELEAARRPKRRPEGNTRVPLGKKPVNVPLCQMNRQSGGQKPAVQPLRPPRPEQKSEPKTILDLSTKDIIRSGIAAGRAREQRHRHELAAAWVQRCPGNVPPPLPAVDVTSITGMQEIMDRRLHVDPRFDIYRSKESSHLTKNAFIPMRLEDGVAPHGRHETTLRGEQLAAYVSHRSMFV